MTATSFSGSVSVYTGAGATWNLEQLIENPSPDVFDYFGYDVSIEGDDLVVGVQNDDDQGSDAGAAYVFTRSGVTWTQQQKILPSDAGGNFGNSVSISGETIAVGAFQNDTGGSNTGAAYIYTRSGSTWSEQQIVQPDDVSGNDWFGISVAIEGDVVAVGSSLDDDLASASGSVYMFVRSSGHWYEFDKLTASSNSNDNFGKAIAISSGSLITGTSEDQSGSGAGSAYIFVP